MPKVAMKHKKTGRLTVALGDVAINSTVATQTPEEDGFTRYIIGKHIPGDGGRITTWGEVGDGEFGSRIRTVIKPGDIVCTTRGPKLRVSVATFGCLSAHTNFILRTKNPDVLLQEYLQALACSDPFQEHLRRNFRGSTNLFVNWSDAAKFAFALPPIEEQRRMSAVLQAIESVVWEYDISSQRAFALWRSLSNAEFSKRAGGGQALDVYFTIASGQVDPKEAEYAKLPLIAPNHIEPGRGRVTELVSAAAQAAISGKYLYEAGSVLYSKIRPELRKAAIAPCRGLCSADMYPLTPSQQLRAEYLLEILLSDVFSRFAVSGSMRTGMPKVNRKHLAEFCFDLPGTKDQDQYLNRSRAIRSAMDEIGERRTSLMSLKSTAIAEMQVA